MKHFFLLLTAFVIVSTGCQKPVTIEEAIAYNDQVVANKDLIVTSILTFNDVEIDSVSISKGYEELKKGILAARDAMSEMPDLGGNEKLKAAGLNYAEFFVIAVNTEYKEIRDIMVKKDLQETDGQQIGMILMELMEREKAEKDAFDKVQRSFAKKYGFQDKASTEETESNNPG